MFQLTVAEITRAASTYLLEGVRNVEDSSPNHSIEKQKSRELGPNFLPLHVVVRVSAWSIIDVDTNIFDAAGGGSAGPSYL